MANLENNVTECRPTEAAMQAAESMGEKLYSFRRLNTEDVFLMFRIVSKIGINEFRKCIENEELVSMVTGLFSDDKSKKTSGEKLTIAGIATALEIANTLLGNIEKCKEDVCQMLANVSGKKINDIKKLDGVVFVEMVIDFVKKPEFPDFFKVVSKLFK